MPATAAPKRSPRRRRAFTTLAVGLGLLVALGSLEVLFRIAGVDGRPLPPRRIDVKVGDEWKTAGYWSTTPLKRLSPYDGVVMGEYLPGLTFRFVYLDDDFNPRMVESHINRLGLRGPETTIAKPEDVFRVLVVGDSFTFGEGVADHETFTALLGERLAPPDGLRLEMINAGVSGYNTTDQLIYLRNRWLALEPDLILCVFYLNDAYDEARFGRLLMGGAAGHSLGDAGPFESPSRVLQFVVNRWRRWRTSRTVEATYRSQFGDDPELAGHDWRASRQALAAMAGLARDRGIPFAVAIFPELFRLDDYPFRATHRAVAAATREMGVPTLDLLDAYAGHPAESLWAHPTDHHPNATAHALAAAAIAEFLTSTDAELRTVPAAR